MSSSAFKITADTVLHNNGIINNINDTEVSRSVNVYANNISGGDNVMSDDVFDIPDPEIVKRDDIIEVPNNFIPINNNMDKQNSRSVSSLNTLNDKTPNELIKNDANKYVNIVNPNGNGAGVTYPYAQSLPLPSLLNHPSRHPSPHSPASNHTPAPAPHHPPAPAPHHPPTSNHTSHSHNIKKTTTKRMVKKRQIKINEDEEIKDTRIDYEDDDENIKIIKTSLFNFVKDIAFNLIFTIPSLRSKLKPILNNPALAFNEIEKQFEDFKDELNGNELDNIKKYVCVEGIRDKLNYILEISFKKIMEDGKIDISDAPQFIQLVYFIINAFNQINDGEIFKFSVSKEHVMLLLHFILKSVFCLTLDGDEEEMAIGLLDTSFKLVKIEVCPLSSKKWYDNFRKLFGCFRKKKSLEDIQ